MRTEATCGQYRLPTQCGGANTAHEARLGRHSCNITEAQGLPYNRSVTQPQRELVYGSCSQGLLPVSSGGFLGFGYHVWGTCVVNPWGCRGSCEQAPGLRAKGTCTTSSCYKPERPDTEGA